MRLDGNTVTVDGDPLVFFHFHGIRIFNPYFVSTGLFGYGIMPRTLRRWFYVGYMRKMRTTQRWLGTLGIASFHLKDGFSRSGSIRDRFLRSGGINAAPIGEIARRAWAQSMLTF